MEIEISISRSCKIAFVLCGELLLTILRDDKAGILIPHWEIA